MSSEKCSSIMCLQIPHFKADLSVKHFWGLEFVVLDMYLKSMIVYCMYNFSSDGSPPAPAQDRKIQWCTISHAEQQKCDGLQIPRLECRRAESVEECIQKVMVLLGHMSAEVDVNHLYLLSTCRLIICFIFTKAQRSRCLCS